MAEETTKKPKAEETNPDTETKEGEESSETPEETPQEESSAAFSGGGGNFFSPEALIMFSIAGTLDLIGIIIILVGLDDFFLTDAVGLFFIGGWTYFRSQSMKTIKGAAEKLGKLSKSAKRLRWLRPLMIISELIPWVGALPCWTILVYFELQNVG